LTDDRPSEPGPLPSGAEGHASRRAGLVQKASKDWKNALVDLGGRNNLLHYRDLKLGTLDLTTAHHEALSGLLLGKATRVSALFSDSGQRDQMLRRIRTIHNKAKENFEERGLETLSIGCGLATWENKRAAWEPCAPVLLQRAALRPLGAAQDEFELSLIGDMEVNPTLLHVLKVDFGSEVDQKALAERIPDGSIDEPWELRETYEWISEQARAIPGFGVARRIVLANFAYAKLAMVTDLDGALDELIAHELIAALAGDEQAREAIRGQSPGPDAIPGPDPLLRRGLKLTAQYGTSGYWIDFAVQHPVQPGRHVLAIECDGATYHSSGSARDRDRLRQEQLERKGWRFHRIWSTEWFHDKDTCAEKAIAAYHDAVCDADEGEATTYFQGSYNAAPSRITPGRSALGQRTSPRPWITGGSPTETYSDDELLRLAQWIRSDDVLRTEEELLQEMIRELGFQRRGKNVVARLTAAITRSAASSPGRHGLP
jgi:very-short-patch-repair endonuclease